MNNSKLTIVAILFSLAIGFFAGMEYKASQLRNALKDVVSLDSNAVDLNKSNSLELNKDEKEAIIVKSIGDNLELSTLNFTVNSVSEESAISGDFGSPTVATKNTKFVVVNITLTNTTKEGYLFFPDNGFELIDNQNRKYQTYENSIGSIKNYLNVRDLAPGIAETGVLVYEIPSDADSYYYLVGKAGTNEIFKVQLK